MLNRMIGYLDLHSGKRPAIPQAHADSEARGSPFRPSNVVLRKYSANMRKLLLWALLALGNTAYAQWINYPEKRAAGFVVSKVSICS